MVAKLISRARCSKTVGLNPGESSYFSLYIAFVAVVLFLFINHTFSLWLVSLYSQCSPRDLYDNVFLVTEW